MLSLLDGLDADGWFSRWSQLSPRRIGNGVRQEVVTRAQLPAWLQEVDVSGAGAYLAPPPAGPGGATASDQGCDISRETSLGLAVMWLQAADLVHPSDFGEFTLSCPRCSINLLKQLDAMGQTETAPYWKLASEVLDTCMSCPAPIVLADTTLRGPSALSNRINEERAPFYRFALIIDVDELSQEPPVVDSSLMERIRATTGLDYRPIGPG